MFEKLMILFSIVCLGVCYEINKVLDNLTFQEFQIKFNKKYNSPEEFKFREEVYEENVRKINLHNYRYSFGAEVFRLGVNDFADLTEKELESLSPPMSK